jgi:hypothetical protein
LADETHDEIQQEKEAESKESSPTHTGKRPDLLREKRNYWRRGFGGEGGVLRWDLDEKLCFVGKDSSWDLRLQCTYYYPVNLFLAQNKLEFFFNFFFPKCKFYQQKNSKKNGKITKLLKPQNWKKKLKNTVNLLFGQKKLEFFEIFRFLKCKPEKEEEEKLNKFENSQNF